MRKAKLNQHFAKFAFLVWNLVLHSLCLSALFSFSEGRNFSALWSENQLFLATLSIGLFAFLYRDEWMKNLQNRFFILHGLVRGGLLALMVSLFGVLASLLMEKSQMIGFSSQVGMSFLSSYSWVLRSLLLMVMSFSLNATTKNHSPSGSGIFLQLFFFWIWFKPGWQDAVLITVLYFLHPSFLFSSALMGGLMVLTHAVFGSNLLGMEFSGLLQFKWPEESYSLLQNPVIILGLSFILGTNKLKKYFRKRKESPAT